MHELKTWQAVTANDKLDLDQFAHFLHLQNKVHLRVHPVSSIYGINNTKLHQTLDEAESSQAKEKVKITAFLKL